MEQTVIQVTGMSCQGCVRNITDVLSALAGVRQAVVDLAQATATVDYDNGQISRAALCLAIEEAGFDAQ
ncbi:MAG: heavy metal-associated domain-containing protein [Dechloromonas sp.]|nr:heavy metal-associated domain-containing protein [Dechloromonas sp.]